MEARRPGRARGESASIDLPIDYGYNGCSGFVPEEGERGAPSMILMLDRQKMTAEFVPGVVIPLGPFFGSMGVGGGTRASDE